MSPYEKCLKALKCLCVAPLRVWADGGGLVLALPSPLVSGEGVFLGGFGVENGGLLVVKKWGGFGDFMQMSTMCSILGIERYTNGVVQFMDCVEP